MKKTIFYFIILIESFSGISQLYTPGGGVTDIDGNNYSTIIINSQEWMSDNLRTTSYANGDPIPHVTDPTQWSNLTTGAWINYMNNIQNDSIYGKLYSSYILNDSRNVCPSGWHTPTYNEWENLILFLEPNVNLEFNTSIIAGGKMKSAGNIQDGSGLWESPNLVASNISGFNGLPSGFGYPWNDGTGSPTVWLWHPEGTKGGWWGGNGLCGANSSSFFRIELNYDEGRANAGCWDIKSTSSIRCIKDQTTNLNEIKLEPKKIIKIVNILGEESQDKVNELLFYIYNDGSVEKKVIVEQ